MSKQLLLMCILANLLTSNVHAQDIAGDWQGTLKSGRDLRLIVRIDKVDSVWNASLFSIDQNPDRGTGIPASSVSLQGSHFKLAIDPMRASYEGTVSVDGSSIQGTWSQGAPLPLEWRRATEDTAWRHPSPHTERSIAVDGDVKLEILDWGGSGQPIVLLAGLGNTAHIFDAFAPKLTDTYHIYGITRRGFGASSTPSSGYSADRLGDDVLAVLDALKLDRPVLVGHSIAGEELSSVGSRHPERIAGLIYLDAAYGHAYYDPSVGDLRIDSIDLQRKLDEVRRRPSRQLIQEVLQTNLPQVERGLQEMLMDLQFIPTPPAGAPPIAAPAAAVQTGLQKYTSIRTPALAIYAVPHDLGPAFANNESARAAYEANDKARTEAQAKAFETGVPSARVVRLPRANHYVFLSNEADVLREIRAFLGSLP